MPEALLTRPCVAFDLLRPDDFLEIERQPSQERLLGAEFEALSGDEFDTLSAQPVAWAARDRGRLVALFGIAEQFAGTHGVGWAILAKGIGAAHLAVTRKAREALLGCRLNRVDLIASAADTPFRLQEAWGPGGRSDLCWALDRRRITPECRWAISLGFRPAHLMHGYGAKCEPHVLFEWFGGARHG